MKSTKDIREQYDLITEKEEAETNKLSALVRAGLFDAKKLPALKKALEKSSDKMTSQEKRMLLNLLDSLISQVTSDEQIYRKVKHNVHGMNEEKKMDTFSKYDPRYEKGFPSDKDLPSVLILKRKAIRVYPDNQKVALYYSQALDRYVTIPYNDIQTSLNEAKNDDDDKKKYRIKPKKKKNKDLPKPGGVKDTKNLIAGKGEYKSKISRAISLRKQGLNIGGIIGTMIHDAKRKERVTGSLAKIKARMDKTRSTQPTQPKSVPQTPAKPKAPVPVPAAPIAKKSSGATKAAMAKTLKKNPNATFTKGAMNNIKEDFRHNLQMIREQRLYEYSASDAAGDAADILVPGVSAYKNFKKGNYGTAALDAAIDVGSVALAAPTLGGSLAARTAVKAGLKGGGKLLAKGATKTAAKGAGKGLKAPSKLRRLLKKGSKLGALAGALGSGGGSGSGSSNSNSSNSSPQPTYNFTAKPSTSNSFDRNRASSDSTTHQRDVQLNRQSQKAMMRESNVLETIKLIVENDILEQDIQFNENKITINNTVAKKLLTVYESINKTNKKKMEQMLNESATSFNKVLTFAVRQ